jgi:hypothetical protein
MRKLSPDRSPSRTCSAAARRLLELRAGMDPERSSTIVTSRAEARRRIGSVPCREEEEGAARSVLVRTREQ